MVRSLALLRIENPETDEQITIADTLNRLEVRELVANLSRLNVLAALEDAGEHPMFPLQELTDADGNPVKLAFSIDGEYNSGLSPEMYMELLSLPHRDLVFAISLSNGYTPEGDYIDRYQEIDSDCFTARLEAVNPDFLAVAREFYRGLKNARGGLRLAKRR
jgi:hypothetical protein